MPQKAAALKFVILLGFVSLCADATYEGARSITGAYLQVLGASGTVVALNDRSITALIVFSSTTQLLAIPFFVWVKLHVNT